MRGYRLLLRLLPRDFRAAYGNDMAAMVDGRLAAASGPLARLAVRCHAVWDVLTAAWAERRRHRRAARSHPPGGWWTGLGADGRFAVRSLVRAPAFTCGTVLTLAVGVGTVTGLFTVVDGVLLQPLPWPRSDRLALVSSPYLDADNRADWLASFPVPAVVTSFTIDGGTARTPDGAETVSVMPVGEGFLEMTGARPVTGRGFLPGDHGPDAGAVVLVREDFWRRWWGDTPAAGAGLELDGRTYDVVGLLPADFSFFRYRDVVVWTPLEPRRVRGVSLLARLPEGLSFDDARTALEPLAERMATPERRAFVERVEAAPVNVRGVAETMLGEVRSTLWILLGSAAVVLLLAAANAGTLWAGRALGRREELAVRAALGAGRWRLLRQLGVEATVVALAAAAIGAALAGLVPSLLALAPDYLPRAENVRVGMRAVGFALAAALAAGMVFGVGPAWLVMRAAGRPAGTRGSTPTSRVQRLQGLLVVGEVAAALVLVVGAALLARTYDALRPDEPGFQVKDRLVASFALSGDAYRSAPEQLRFAEDLQAELTRSGGAAELATDLPLTGMSIYLPVTTVDGAPVGEGGPGGIHFRAVSAGYFQLMGMPLVAGRGFTRGDRASGEIVAVVNESAARRLWGEGPPPLDHSLLPDLDRLDGPVRVVGVVRDAWILRGPEPRPEVYVPFAQLPFGRFHVVMDAGPASALSPGAVRRAVSAVDAGVPIRELAPLEDLVSWSVVVPRFQATVLGTLTAVGLFLAAMGCFAVLSQMLGRRRRELGIRLALGASGRGLMRLVLGRALRLAGAGVLLGGALAWAGSRVLEAHLYGIGPRDPGTFVGAGLLLLLIAAVAALRPALEAARLEPVRTLRQE